MIASPFEESQSGIDGDDTLATIMSHRQVIIFSNVPFSRIVHIPLQSFKSFRSFNVFILSHQNIHVVALDSLFLQ